MPSRGVLRLHCAVGANPDLIVLAAAADLTQSVDVSVAKDLPEGMTVLDAGRAGVVCKVLVGGWAPTTCITATSVFEEQKLTIPDHHKVASISSICGDIE